MLINSDSMDLLQVKNSISSSLKNYQLFMSLRIHDTWISIVGYMFMPLTWVRLRMIQPRRLRPWTWRWKRRFLCNWFGGRNPRISDPPSRWSCSYFLVWLWWWGLATASTVGSKKSLPWGGCHPARGCNNGKCEPIACTADESWTWGLWCDTRRRPDRRRPWSCLVWLPLERVDEDKSLLVGNASRLPASGCECSPCKWPRAAARDAQTRPWI